MNWRLASRLSVITLAALVVIIVAVLGTRAGGLTSNASNLTPAANSSGLQGTDLGGVPAPNFRLTDQFGRPVSLAQFKGKPVVLTFLYTHCPDQCPLTAEKLHAVMLSLGSDAQRVGVVAVSTDPRRDTTAAALNFSQVHRMQNYWHYLLGTESELSPVWSSYSVYAAPTPTSTGGSVAHTTAVYVIDKQGRERVFFGSDFTSAQLTKDLQILLKE
ncbi:MAG: SCO family protein [Chloroflexi bacterium]|nr:MAG: SCO family protein [Chloroflexota bacterium]